LKKFVRKTEGKTLPGRSRCRWEGSEKNIKEIRCVDVEWIQLAQDRVPCWDPMGMVMNLPVP
jgi:hypothetical protein